VFFTCNEMGHYSINCPKPKLGNGGSKVIYCNPWRTPNSLKDSNVSPSER
jgi:hypothetical protein